MPPQTSSFLPNVTTYNATVNASEKEQLPQRALQQLAAMRDKGLPPNVTTYNATISA